MERPQNPSIYEIAKLSGASVGTVSNVLNHPAKVRPELKNRVLKVIEEVGYAPSASARALSKGSADLLGAVFFDITNPFFASAAHFLELAAREQGMSLLFTNTQQDPGEEIEAIRRMRKAGAEGLVVTSTSRNLDELVQVSSQGTPVMLLAQRSANEALAFASINDRQGMAKIARHVLDKGMTKFCFIQERNHAIQHIDRWNGFLGEIVTEGIMESDVLIESIEAPTMKSGYDAALRVLDEGVWPECFICLNDFVAIGVTKALSERGIRVGEDLAVTGFDDIEYAAVNQTPITTVRQPTEEMARFCVEQIIAATDTATRGDVVRPLQSKLFEAELIPRQSA